MALQSFLLVPYGSRLLPCQVSAPLATVLVAKSQGLERFCPKFSFRKGVNPAIAPP